MPKQDILQFFEFGHLPVQLQVISAPFGELAKHLDLTLPDNPEKAFAMRKLLEAKDCAIRARLFRGDAELRAVPQP